MRRRPSLVTLGAITGVALGIAVVALVARGYGSRSVCAAAPTGALRVEAPRHVAAGQVLDATVVLPTSVHDLPVAVTVVGPYGAWPSVVRAEGISAQVHLDAAMTRAAGDLELRASTCNEAGSAVVTVDAGPAVAPVVPLVGAKRVIADGTDNAAVVTLPQDAMGNPVPDGTSVEWRLTRPSGREDAATTGTGHLLAYRLVTAGTIAGRTTAVATADGAAGPAELLLEVPGPPPDGFPLALERAPSLTATGATVGVRDLRDARGNRLVDGTAVAFVVDDPDGSQRRIDGVLIAGAASVVIPAPSAAGASTVHAVVDGSSSASLAVGWPPVGGTAFPVAATLDPALHVLTVTLGPVRDAVGAIPPDGIPAWIVVQCGPAWSAQAQTGLTSGSGEARLAVPAGLGTCSVRAATAGVTGSTTVDVP